MDVQIIRRVLRDMFTFDRRDFAIGSSPTGFHVALNPVPQEIDECEFQMRDVSVGTSKKVSFGWGRFANIVPDGFTPNGKTDPFTVTGAAFFYARGAANTARTLFESCEFFMFSSPASAVNTTTYAYYLVGAATIETSGGTSRLVLSGTCGPIYPNLCDLVAEEAP